jgi:hypothetical protein
MSEIRVQQIYLDRSIWPPKEEFQIVVDGEVVDRRPFLLAACKRAGEIFLELNGQQSLELET